MKSFRKQYLLISVIPILSLAFAVYWATKKHQQPVDKGTRIGDLWFPPLVPEWSKKVHRSSINENFTYSKKINGTSSIFVLVDYFPPDKEGRPDPTASKMMDMTEKSDKAPIFKKIISYQSHRTHFRGWPTLIIQENYITEPYVVKDHPGYNGVYGKRESNVNVNMTEMYIFRPSDWYGLSVSSRGQNSAEAQAVKKSVWQLMTQQLRVDEK